MKEGIGKGDEGRTLARYKEPGGRRNGVREEGNGNEDGRMLARETGRQGIGEVE